jgi:glycosyltransferase involved in cell wall biosynthesis
VIVPTGDAKALAKSTGQLLDNPGTRAALSSSARESARRFQWRAVADDHLKFIMNIAATQTT